jgi:methyl-accepting chemotaxis protein
MDEGDVRISWPAVAGGASAVFLLALVLPSGLQSLLASDPFRLGPPQIAAALAVALVAAAVLYGRESRHGAQRVACEQNAMRLEASLKHQTGLAQGILGGLPMPFLLVDAEERAVKSNVECLKMLELDGKPEDFYGQTLAQIFYNDPSRKTAVGKSIHEGQVFRNLEVAIKGHRGGTRHVLANVFPLYDSDRRCLGGLCLYIDMTVLKEKEQVIVQKNENIGRAAENADSLCQRLHDASSRLAGGISQTAHGSEAQKARLSEVGAGLSQMSEAVIDVAKSAAAASQNADETRGKAEAGARLVGEVIAAIGGVAERTQAMQARVSELGAQAANIGQILNVISDIADQTNLLALNAAIEAARAGDAGRGFAVVADEVRKLAEKTMTATKEVGEAIRSVQEGARRAAEGMSGAAEAVEKSTRLADSAGGSLQDILRISQGSADQVRNIAAASEEQSSAAEEISRGMDEVRQVADNTAQDMSSAAKAVDELVRMADELKAIIGTMQAC